MKARYNAARKLSDKEQVELYKVAFDASLKSIISGVLYILLNRGWHKDRLRKLFEDIVSLYSMPPVFGKSLDDRDVIKYVSEYVGLTAEDWQRLKDSAQIEVR